MKKTFYFVFILLIILITLYPSFGVEKSASVYVNKQNVATVPIIYKYNKYFAPASLLEKAFYMAVSYDPLLSVVVIEDTVERGDAQYSLNHYWWAMQIGNPLLVKNSPKQDKVKVTNLEEDESPILTKSTVYIPVKVFGSIVGGQAEYKNEKIVFTLPERTIDDIDYRRENTIATGREFTVTPEMALKLAGSLIKGGTIKLPPLPQIE
ncbi:MAG TPA: hypothetical protein PL110_14920 [Candidatus Eremiobacteraeota bacterium]|nr:hypothetical protein [Candidatus Eremiobacteraeota bacterium]